MTPHDVHDAPRPLPLRLDPLPRETLPGYLQRVAVTFSASPAAVVAPISQRWAARIRAGKCSRTSGIAMTDPTLAATATRLNLETDEVRAMLASNDEHITIGFDRVPAATFDPATGTATLADQATLGWLVDARFDRFCGPCDRQTPDITRLEWRYPWYTICPIHHHLLRPHNPAENADTDFGELLEVQEQLMAIIKGEASFARLSRRDGFIELNAAVEILSRVRGRLRLKMTGLVEPWFIARILPDAFTAIQTPMDNWPDTVRDLAGGKHPGEALAWALERHGATSPFGLRADLLRYRDQPGQYLGLWAKDIRIPAEHLLLVTSAVKERARATFPALLPREFVAPTLSDFTPWLSIPQAQRAAGLAALMIVTGDDMKTSGEHQGNHGRHQMPLRRTWWNLESRGLLADYFDAVAASAQQLLVSTDLPAVASRTIGQRVS